MQQEVHVDARLVAADASYSGAAKLHLARKEFASPYQYFLRFLPTEHISEVVIPAINEHAQSLKPDFVPVTYDEYLCWIGFYPGGNVRCFAT